MNQDQEFRVLKGRSEFKIVDDRYTYGSYQTREEADHYCEMLNEKWAKAARS